MRFHVVSLPHTNVTKAFANCAYTAKVHYFCNMMTSLGHEVFLYAGTETEANVTELITCLSEEERLDFLDGKHYVHASFDNTLPAWQMFNNTAIDQIKKRIQKKDFICLIGGTTQEPIAKAFPEHMSVEFGIGYGGTFAKYRVFESNAWRHSIYAMHKNPTTVDGNFYDAVIPGYLDPEMFPFQPDKEDYYLYIGRMIPRKGVDIASQVCEKLGARLIMAGPGDYIPKYGEYIGPVDPETRAKLFGGAIATFVPTLYIEPFGNVHVESMMCGTPVITTDWGVFTETVENGFNGYRCNTFAEFVRAAEDVKNLSPKKIADNAYSKYSLDMVRWKYDRYFRRLLDLWENGWYTL
jgi:glycosyltransferase involved in cell wall biosynthesis